MKGLGIFCPGQGNQHPAMFDKLLNCPAAENAMEAASSAFGSHPYEFLQHLAPQELFCNSPAQLLIGTLQMVTWSVLRKILPLPNVFAGYSMGELAAYGCVGALNIEATLALMTKRAKLMDEASPQPAGLLAVRGLGREQVDSLCRSAGCEIAIVNNPEHFVIGGPDEALTRCESNPLAVKATAIKRLQVNVPSHTSWLREASRQFADELNISTLGDPPCPVLAGVNGSVVRTRVQAISALSQQISNPINWMACMQTAVEMGCGVILELGPGNALAKMLQDVFPELKVRSVEDFRTLEGVAAWVEKQCQ
ncbi:MAG: malonate decarboxylase subunit epsilon [Burkholderiaceae bacterium]|nr:malonate decarboxylase subunit epsilon [Burkholderiaceae bacterium]